ncbi:MAG: hypothetical protein A2Z88_02335 [Omnitrophica WOR_2 bacterium GWA2_47_8]|nr:MAG: hypothetical protein A2Z88_02335 [Omnitrophica WOR_2 bacterium GWA2_47_8]
MKNAIVTMVVVLSFFGFSTLSFLSVRQVDAGMIKPLKKGEIRRTGQSIYKARRAQAAIPKSAPIPKTEVKTNEKTYK